MRSISPLWLACALSLLVACETGTNDLDAGADGGAFSDVDQDSISDADEGARMGTDTDQDGVEDYRDDDSDGDGIEDRLEAGDADPMTAPVDTDMDGTPDFRDLDADDNGIPDSEESILDTDEDGSPDFADVDDDNDGADDSEELRGVVDTVVDSDGDGLPNFKDPDSDNDLILDGDEAGRDTDGDGLLDWVDTDSDDDGIPDRDEAGDDDLRSRPINTDADTGDSIPDFRDPDSDADGLSDRLEHQNGSSPTVGDTDMDGVSDLIEVSAGTDPLDPEVNPRTQGDFVFVVPHMQDPAPERDTLEFRTNVQFADIYFLFDESGSMSGEIGALQSAVTTLANNITCRDSGVACTRDGECTTGEICSSLSGTCIEDPARNSCLLSPWTGVGKYEVDYDNLLSVQPDPAATGFALGFGTTGATENLNGAVWSVVDPEGSTGSSNGCSTPMPGRIGCVGFREEAVRIVVAFTDEPNNDSVPAADVGAALLATNTSFIGVWTSGSSTATGRQDLVDLATEAHSVDGSGDPLVFDGEDAAIVPAVEDAIREIVEGVPLRVTILATDEPDDDGDALQFIDHLEVNTSGGRCSAIAAVEDTDGDTHDDAFPAVLPGTPVCWDVVVRRNETVEAATEPLVFEATLTVSGDDSPLDARTIYFLVPPYIPPPDLD